MTDSRRGFCILLVEDIETNVNMAKIRLEQQGHEVIVARNGREAVEAVKHEKIDVVLMDIHMPEMDGIEATTHIRTMEIGIGKHVPIIALTADAMFDEKDHYFAVGMDAVAGKPIDFEGLFKTMENLVPKGKGRVIKAVETKESPPLETEMPVLEGIDLKKGLKAWKHQKPYSNALLRFSKDYENIVDTLSQLIHNGEIDSAFRITHTLKGLAGNLALTDVYNTILQIDAAFRDERINDAKNLLPVLSGAMTVVVDSIKKLELVQNNKKMPKKEMHPSHLTSIFNEMLAAYDQFNPYILQPFIEQLEDYFSKDKLTPISRNLERFEFGRAKEETIKLAKTLNLDLEKKNG